MRIAVKSAAAIIATERARRRRKGRIRRVLALGTSVLALAAVIAEAQSAPYIARSQVVGASATCPVVLVNFNTPLSVQTQSVSGDGLSLTVSLSSAQELIPGESGGDAIETQPALDVPGMGMVFVSMDTSGAMPILRMRFSAPVSAQVTQSGERSLVVALSTPGDGNGCFRVDEPQEPVTAVEDPDATTLPGQDEVALPPLADIDAGGDEIQTEAAALLMEARSAFTAQDYGRVIRSATALLALPENSYSPDAQELLGVARERNGQMAHAIAEYEIYLDKYPDAEGVDRVRQRLAAILTAQVQQPRALRAASGATPLDPRVVSDGSDEASLVSIPRVGETFRPLGPQPGWGDRGAAGDDWADAAADQPTFRGFFSTYYFLNQASTYFTELDTNTTDEDTELLQNSVVFGIDMSDEKRFGETILRWRFNGDYEYDFTDASQSGLSLSRVYANFEFGEDGPQLRLGRQTRNDGGIRGRFDGARLSYPVNEDYTVNAVLGMPVDSKSDGVFAGNRIVAGVSVDYFGFGENTEVSAYLVGERREGFSERFAVGVEGTYSANTTSVFGIFDYDIGFNQVNIARLSWTRQMENQSSVSAALDYRRSPLLSLSSALQGQTETTLTQLATMYSLAEMQGLALDRSSDIWSGSLSYQRPLNDIWQVSADATVTYTSGNPGSGGVAAVPAPGWEYYLSGQLVGTGVFRENDVLGIAARFADTASSELYLLDAYWRYDVNDRFRIKPRVKVAHRNLTTAGGTEDFAIPSMTIYYEVNDTSDFELEVGSRFSVQTDGVTTERSNEVFVFAGFTKEF